MPTTTTTADPAALAELLAAAELQAGRYWWRASASAGGGAELRYCPPVGGPVEWAADPGELDGLGLCEAEAPEAWEPLPTNAEALAVTDSSYWAGELERLARELADAGYRAAGSVVLGWWRGTHAVAPDGEAIGLAELLAAADRLTYA